MSQIMNRGQLLQLGQRDTGESNNELSHCSNKETRVSQIMNRGQLLQLGQRDAGESNNELWSAAPTWTKTCG